MTSTLDESNQHIAHRIYSSGVGDCQHEYDGGTRCLRCGFLDEIDPAVIAIARKIAAQKTINDSVHEAAKRFSRAARPDVIPEADRELFRREKTLRDFYLEWMLPDRLKRLAKNTISVETLNKDSQSLNRWDRYSRPADWAGEWPGLPLKWINDSSVQRVFDNAIAAAELCSTSIATWWKSLRVLMNAAARRGALDHCPDVGRLTKQTAQKVHYHAERIERIYHELRSSPVLQVAFVLSISTGLRPVDLFLLRWQNVTLTTETVGGQKYQMAYVEFVARKTTKCQRLPIHPTTCRHLARLPKLGDHLFGSYCSPLSKDPERSHQARRRNRLMKQALQRALAVETDHDWDVFADKDNPWKRPWQIGRLTANERFERHRVGLGQFMLAHSRTLNSLSYREPSREVLEGVLTIDQPECFQPV